MFGPPITTGPIGMSSYSSYSESSFGYSRSKVNTSVFISTGDPRWGYDPYCYSYYDYNRRCYYDPYRNAYYPVGCRPTIRVGASHPHGWHPGRAICPPPRRVCDTYLSGYNDRHETNIHAGFSWSKHIHLGSGRDRYSDDWDRPCGMGSHTNYRSHTKYRSHSDNHQRPIRQQPAPAPTPAPSPAPTPAPAPTQAPAPASTTPEATQPAQ